MEAAVGNLAESQQPTLSMLSINLSGGYHD